jgi:hypothetical protein
MIEVQASPASPHQDIGPLTRCLRHTTTVSEDRPTFFEPFVVGAYLSCKFTQLFDPDEIEKESATLTTDSTSILLYE